MIRWFEVKGLEDDKEPPEAFGFVDTVTDRVVEIAGQQLFFDYKDFRAAVEYEKWDAARQERFDRLIPIRLRPPERTAVNQRVTNE